MDLSLRAGFNVNYVRSIEKGVFTPQPEAVEKLAQALELTGEERTAFFHAYDSSRTPKSIRDAAGREPIPGLVIWQWLPRLLWTVPHCDSVSFNADPDQVLVDVVRSAASLLSWVALPDRGISARQRNQLLKLIEKPATPEAPRGPAVVSSGWVPLRQDATTDTSGWATLPQLWRKVLLTSERSVRDLVGRLANWEYSEEKGNPWQCGNVTFQFSDPELDKRAGVFCAPTADVVTIHDAIVAWKLGDDLGFSQRWDMSVLKRTQYRKRIDQLLAPHDDVLRRDLSLAIRGPAQRRPGMLSTTIRLWASRRNFADLALRAFDCPRVAEVLFSHPEQPNEDLNAMRDRIRQRLDLLREALPRAEREFFEAFYGQPSRHGSNPDQSPRADQADTDQPPKP